MGFRVLALKGERSGPFDFDTKAPTWAELPYRVEGATTLSEASYAFFTGIGTADNEVVTIALGLPLLGIQQMEEQDDGSYTVLGRYQFPSSGSGGGGVGGGRSDRLRLSTTGGTIHIDCALEHIHDYPAPGKTAPNHKGAINVQQDGTVGGVDIEAGPFEFSLGTTIPTTAMTDALVAKWASVKDHVNDAPFLNWKAGEVLCKGFELDATSTETDVEFYFAQQDNKTNMTVAGITGITKKGWHYLWIEPDWSVDTSAKRAVRPPLAAHVERVYEEADLAVVLGFGSNRNTKGGQK